MTDSLDIAQVAKLTGLTARALRFYEARGLIMPLRTSSGRRHFGPAQLERLHQIIAMKRAGLTLAQIQKLSEGRSVDLRALVSAQIEVLSEQAEEIATSRTLLNSVLSRIDRSEPIDVATFCSLIRNGDTLMSEEKMREIALGYMDEDQKQAFADSLNRPGLPDGFDQEAYGLKWKDLGSRIKAAMPMDPASDQAQDFAKEWQTLFQPFKDMATPKMMEGVNQLYDNIEQWDTKMDSGFDAETFRFMQTVFKAGSAG